MLCSCGSDDSGHAAPQTGCTAGEQVACSCTDGSPGFKTCRADGVSFGDCACAEPTDGGLDHSVDAPADGKSDGSDTSLDGEGPPCVHPADNLDQASWPVPTPGACQGSAAVVCDPATHLLAAAACKAGEKCVTYEVQENPDPTMYTQLGRTYTWAGCIPDGAQPCAWSWKEQSGSYPPGWWESDFTNACVTGAVHRCLMPAIPDAPAYGALYAGTATGYIEVETCASGEECADDPGFPGNPDCFASPLVVCDPADSKCTANVLFDCYGYPYQKKVDCTALGQVCREDCDSGLPFKTASCKQDLPAGLSACDASTYAASCTNADTIQRCDACFLQAGVCKCYALARACDEVGCGWAADCKCADVTTGGKTTSQCIDASFVLCDEAATQDACNGQTASRCVGYKLEVDCTKYGEVCLLASGVAGCVSSPATTCSSTLTRTCSGNVITGCCPASGMFQTDAYVVPCTPGNLVKMDCSSLYGPFKCQTVPGGAECMM
jgi:hypothetical protein